MIHAAGAGESASTVKGFISYFVEGRYGTEEQDEDEKDDCETTTVAVGDGCLGSHLTISVCVID